MDYGRARARSSSTPIPATRSRCTRPRGWTCSRARSSTRPTRSPSSRDLSAASARTARDRTTITIGSSRRSSRPARRRSGRVSHRCGSRRSTPRDSATRWSARCSTSPGHAIPISRPTGAPPRPSSANAPTMSCGGSSDSRRPRPPFERARPRCSWRVGAPGATRCTTSLTPPIGAGSRCTRYCATVSRLGSGVGGGDCASVRRWRSSSRPRLPPSTSRCVSKGSRRTR